ncbi:MAG TPA: 3-oxoacyl-ACP reductase family protein [Desulfomonilaceae bacterium]|nr:3-oxoacyl-ACP reductase family protein [Desulfomonilaceae bacterium]
MRLAGKAAVVTGSSRGVGRNVALAYAKEGADVLVNYSSSEGPALELVDEIRGLGRKAVAFRADVANKAEVEAMMSAAKEHFGRLDILVNNAGFTRPNMLYKMSEEEWDAVLNAHLKGPFFCVQAAFKYFKEQNYGKVINVSSVAGLVGTVGQVNYSAAKGGILSFTKSVAREFARYNVCANVISLGIVETDMTEKIRSDEKLSEIYMNRILLKRFGKAEDISPAFIFLASNESDYITGQILCVDGGYGMI